nr:serine hydrolase domain-containing protein [Amycolatopsis australiensis]
MASEPGTQFHHHNPNYEVAARIVEAVAGQPFPGYLRTRLFTPLGMTSSTTVDEPPADVARGYVRAFGIDVPVTEPVWFTGGSHGVLSTAGDLARWLIAQRDGGGVLTRPRSRSRTPPHPAATTRWAGRPGGRDSCPTTASGSATPPRRSLLPGGYGIAVLATTGLALDNDAESLAQGLATLVGGETPEPALPAGVVADRVLAALLLLSVVLAVLGAVRARRWAARRTSPWRAGLRLLPYLVPGLVLLFLPELMSVVFAGRQGTFGQLLYVWPGLAGTLGCGTLGALVVLVTRVSALVSGRDRPGREESGETTGVVAWESESV